MKLLFTFTLITCIASSIFTDVQAQTTPLQDTASGKTTLVIPPLNALIDSAIKHNAMIEYRGHEIEAKEANLKSQRTYWLRNVGVQADTRYGTFDNFSSNANGQSTTLLAVTSKQFNYGAGLYMKLPIYDLLNRKTQIKQARAEVEQAKSLAQSQEDELRQIVIRQYQETLLKQKLLTIKSQNLGSATVNMEMIEKQFRNGLIPLAEYVRISDMTARIQSEYEMARSEFLLSKQLLEEIAGFTFSNTGSK
jgi:outer membrane protein TolC